MTIDANASPGYRRAVNKVDGHKRRARKRGLTVLFCPSDWHQCRRYFKYRCAYCGNFCKGTLDVFIPLGCYYSPGFTVYNVLPACDTCNQSKADQNPYSWLAGHYEPRRVSRILYRIETYFENVSSLSGVDTRNKEQSC